MKVFRNPNRRVVLEELELLSREFPKSRVLFAKSAYFYTIIYVVWIVVYSKKNRVAM